MWISVKDKLPEPGDEIEYYDGMFDKVGRCVVDFPPEEMDGDITHWQLAPPDKCEECIVGATTDENYDVSMLTSGLANLFGASVEFKFCPICGHKVK